MDPSEGESQGRETSTKSRKGKLPKLKCETTPSSSHTQIFKRDRHDPSVYNLITKKKYLGHSESISGSSDSFKCDHGPWGKQYTEQGLLKRGLKKNLDLIPTDPKWTEKCPPPTEVDLLEKIQFLLYDPVGKHQVERIRNYFIDYTKITAAGFNIASLDTLCSVIDKLVEDKRKCQWMNDELQKLLVIAKAPVHRNAVSDVITQYDKVVNYVGYLGYLLVRLEDNESFNKVVAALVWLLAAPDHKWPNDAIPRRWLLAAAPAVLQDTLVHMTALSPRARFPAFLQLAFILANSSVDNCINMMKDNIIENIFYRFNPYFPKKDLPLYEIIPVDPDDPQFELGDSGIHQSTSFTLLFILLQTTIKYIEDHPKFDILLPCPDAYAQHCFLWMWRYECCARDHHQQRLTMTIIAAGLCKIFKRRLDVFSCSLMPDAMTLSVCTEIPPRQDWTNKVNFNLSRIDAQFKIMLIHLSVDLFKIFPYNRFMVESRHWLFGLMYLIDPGLSPERRRWSPALFAELRKASLQALVFTLPLMPDRCIFEYGLLRRVMWYIEWYTESPYEIPVLYWCVRLLRDSTFTQNADLRKVAIKYLFETHGTIILIRLCYTLLRQTFPPVEKCQAVISLTLRLLSRCIKHNHQVSCCVYPGIKWPQSVNTLSSMMLDVVLGSFDQNYVISERWMVSLLYFIWQVILWMPVYRKTFVEKNGIYKLLDIITVVSAPTQCIALAVVCDAALAGVAVAQLVSWRANYLAASVHPPLVKRGATIATLLAAIFRDECQKTGVKLDHNGIIQDLENPLMSTDLKKAITVQQKPFTAHSSVSLVAGDMAGSRMSKVYALLHLLSEDLEEKVSLADEAYNLYKNIQLAPEDETILVLSSYYLTIKLNEVWTETKANLTELLPSDEATLEEFLHMGKGWAKEIKILQDDFIEKDKKKESDKESSLYSFLDRVRLNTALDALRLVRCVVRTSDRTRIAHLLLQEAVSAHHRRSLASSKLGSDIIRSYAAPLDDQNVTGQYIKIFNKPAKNAQFLRSMSQL